MWGVRYEEVDIVKQTQFSRTSRVGDFFCPESEEISALLLLPDYPRFEAHREKLQILQSGFTTTSTNLQLNLQCVWKPAGLRVHGGVRTVANCLEATFGDSVKFKSVALATNTDAPEEIPMPVLVARSLEACLKVSVLLS